MALPAERVRVTAHGFEYRARGDERPHTLPWEQVRAITAGVEPAWSGAEVTVRLALAGDEAAPDAVPLEDGERLEVFGGFAAARAVIAAARERSPQALVGPLAQLLVALPQDDAEDERALRRKTKEYGFASAAGLALGRQHLARGRLEKADNDFQAVVARAPLDAEAWRWLGLTRLLAGKGADAQAAFDRLIGLGARDAETYYLRGLSFYRQRRFAPAAEEWAGVLRAWPQDPGGRNLLACSLTQQWRLEEALPHLDTVGADAREGWRLMAQKCRRCVEGYAAYRERMARQRGFRWRQRWQAVGARLAAVFGVLYTALQFILRRYPWLTLVAFAVLAAGFYLFDARGRQRRAEDQLADAQGQVPNLPCWYASLVWGNRWPRQARRSWVETIRRRWGEES
jgi:tetratricopeptide (TPR) repeat protein